MVRNMHSGNENAPALVTCLNLGNLRDLPANSTGPLAGFSEQLAAVAAAGFQSVQFVEGGDATLCAQHDLAMFGSARINDPAEADSVAAGLAAAGHSCATLHVGWGTEDDDQCARLIEAILTASQRRDLPLYIETHRATICQDMWRTVQWTKRFPEIRFNGDFSHWYTGQEMVYGGFESKFQFIEPVLERVRFLHGRIGSPGCIQVNIDDGDTVAHPYVEHFTQLWSASFAGFLRSAKPGDCMGFAVELLEPRIYYARVFADATGQMAEESDRWAQALVLKRIAESAFDQARQTVLTGI
jgi:hypothetical protein